MLTVATPPDLAAHAGAELGATGWRAVTADQIAAFVALTGDDHWVHADPERAARDLPGGKVIAHGLFLLSLIPRMQRELFRIERRGMGLNYGYERVRFTAQVPADSRIRLRQRLVAAGPHRAGTRIELESTMDVEGQERPALVATGILLIADG